MLQLTNNDGISGILIYALITSLTNSLKGCLYFE